MTEVRRSGASGSHGGVVRFSRKRGISKDCRGNDDNLWVFLRNLGFNNNCRPLPRHGQPICAQFHAQNGQSKFFFAWWLTLFPLFDRLRSCGFSPAARAGCKWQSTVKAKSNALNAGGAGRYKEFSANAYY